MVTVKTRHAKPYKIQAKLSLCYVYSPKNHYFIERMKINQGQVRKTITKGKESQEER